VGDFIRILLGSRLPVDYPLRNSDVQATGRLDDAGTGKKLKRSSYGQR
jgi:hypothetical protein